MKANTIAFIVREPVGGIWKHIEILIKFFHKNYNIILIGNLENGDKKFQIFKKQNPDIEYINIPISRSPSLSDLYNIIKIKKILNKKKVDIFHGHGAKGGIYVRILGKICGAKVVYTPHGGSVHPAFGKISSFLYKIIENMLYFFTDKVVAESQYTKNQYLKMLFFQPKVDDKIVLNYNGVKCKNHSINDSGKQTPPFIVSSFGMLRYEKGQDILILAAKKLLEHGYPIKLNLYGEGEGRELLEKLIEENALHNDVLLCGETDVVEAEMRRSTLVVQPSRFESFGYVLLEAMCVGIPVIASTAGGMPEIIKHDLNGRLFKSESIEDLAKQIEFTLDNPKRAKLYIKEGKHTVNSKFSSKAMCQGLEQIYESLLRQPN